MKQKIALEILKTGRNVFLTGSAGSGKTYLLNQYIQYLKERDIEPSIVAPTGIAASHLNGTTIHSFFGIGITESVDDYFLDILLQKEFLYRRLRKVKILIIDEISMVSPKLFSSLDKILRSFKSVDEPFGGVQLVLSGDFFQLPPISKQSEEIKFAWQNNSWSGANLRVCYLEEKFRQNDDVLIDILEEIRSGLVSEKSLNIFRSCYRKKLKRNFQITRLYTHNKDVDRINQEKLQAIPGSLKIFQSQNKGSKKNIEKILNSSLVTEELKLKVGAIVIFIKNNYEAGYINGTLGKVINFSKITKNPIVEIFSGRKIIVELEDWKLENSQGEIKAVVRQIPLKLAWALTVHKSQGMTLDAAEIDLSQTFELGQGYVALSRIKSIQGLRLMGLNKTALLVDKRALEIDKEAKKLSYLNTIKFQSFSPKEKEKMFQAFIIKNGGITQKEAIEKNKEKNNKIKKFQPKESTLEKTKKLLKKKKTIKEIAQIREISKNTIFQHIKKIKKIDTDFDIDYLKPRKKIIIDVQGAVLAIKKKKNKDDFLASKEVKLKSIFEYLNEKIDYDDIKLALFFISE